jgi:hypothetical protein
MATHQGLKAHQQGQTARYDAVIIEKPSGSPIIDIEDQLRVVVAEI